MGMDDDRLWALRRQYEAATRERDEPRKARLRAVYGSDEGVMEIFDQIDRDANLG